nr:CD166 antigen-like [Danio rerio]|eukprot:XP_021333786.1 CD166 antigen-like [Danio rerio]
MDELKISIKPQSSVFTGDTVTLSCDAGRSTVRRIIWYKDSSRIGTVDETKTLTDVKISDGGWYKCGVIAANNATTQSPAVRLTVTERLKASLRVQPDGGVFRGQTVTFTCHIPDSDVTRWSYSWNKDDSVIQDSESREYRISSVDESHAGLYSCRGEETGGSRHTHTSDQHTLTVSVYTESYKAVLTVQSEPSEILRGDTVTLTCDIQGEDWKYRFHCGDKEYKSEEKEFNITVESTQMCRCSGWRQSSGSSKWSNEVTLTVSDIMGSESSLSVLSALKLVSFLVAASPYLLVTIILGVKYCRAHAQDNEVDQHAATEE